MGGATREIFVASVLCPGVDHDRNLGSSVRDMGETPGLMARRMAAAAISFRGGKHGDTVTGIAWILGPDPWRDKLWRNRGACHRAPAMRLSTSGRGVQRRVGETSTDSCIPKGDRKTIIINVVDLSNGAVLALGPQASRAAMGG